MRPVSNSLTPLRRQLRATICDLLSRTPVNFFLYSPRGQEQISVISCQDQWTFSCLPPADKSKYLWSPVKTSGLFPVFPPRTRANICDLLLQKKKKSISSSYTLSWLSLLVYVCIYPCLKPVKNTHLFPLCTCAVSLFPLENANNIVPLIACVGKGEFRW